MYTQTQKSPLKKKAEKYKIINRERKFLIYAHNNHSVMGILTLHSQNRLASILDVCSEKMFTLFLCKNFTSKKCNYFFLNGI